MNEKPDWLPDIVSVDGEWEETLSRLYGIFESDFIKSNIKLNQYQVWWNRQILEGERYEEGFWHLISKYNEINKERLFDPRRAERLPWCGPTIRNCNDAYVRIWEYKEGKSKLRIYVWLEKLDYVIILEKRRVSFGQIAFLVTAFYIEGKSTKKTMQRKYDRRIV